MVDIELKIVEDDHIAVLCSNIEDILNGNHDVTRFEMIYARQVGKQSEVGQFVADPGGPNIPEWWHSDPDIFQGGCSIYCVSKGYYIPSLGVIINASGEVLRRTFAEAKFFIQELHNLPYTNFREGKTYLSVDFFSQLENAAITMPWGAVSNYGHFLLDCLPSVYLIKLRFGDMCSFVFPPLKDWQKQHLDLLDIKYCELTEAIYEIKIGMYLNIMDHFLHVVNDSVKSMVEFQVKPLNTDSVNLSRIYVSRSGNSNRRYRDEYELERLFEDKGYNIIHPEMMLVKDQIRVFREASHVVSFAGAALANVIYCAKGARILEIQSTVQGGIWVRNLAVILELEWTSYFCGGRLNDEPLVINGIARPGLGGEALLNISDFREFITSRGFID